MHGMCRGATLRPRCRPDERPLAAIDDVPADPQACKQRMAVAAALLAEEIGVHPLQQLVNQAPWVLLLDVATHGCAWLRHAARASAATDRPLFRSAPAAAWPLTLIECVPCAALLPALLQPPPAGRPACTGDEPQAARRGAAALPAPAADRCGRLAAARL